VALSAPGTTATGDLSLSETISQLPQTATRTSQTDIIPVTIGYGGPGTGITYGKPVADILSASGLIYAADPIFGGGVKADGVSDDTTAWTIVLQAAANTGAWVVAPPGVSLVSAITLPDGAAIIGRNTGSYSSTVGFPNLGTVIQGSSASSPTISLGQFCQLHNLQVVGTSAQPCVQATKGYIDLFDSTMLGGSVGVDFLNVGGPSTLLGLRIHDCPTAGIRGAHHASIGGATITGCGSGIVLTDGCHSVRLAVSRIEYCTNYGITADGTGGALRDLVISGSCSFEANGKANVQLRAVSNSAVTGNSLGRGGQNQSGSPGGADDCNIYLQNCSGVTVTGNTSRTGLNNSGAGYNSPYWAVFDGGGNTNCQIAANIWAFHNNSTGPTGGPINSTSTFNLASTLNVTFWS
jgi:hypothetical protein